MPGLEQFANRCSSSRPLPPCAAGEAVWEARRAGAPLSPDPCRLVRQVKQFGKLDRRVVLGFRPLPPCAAGEAVWEAKGIVKSRLLALQTASPAAQGGRGRRGKKDESAATC